MKIGIITGHRISGLMKDMETILVETPYGDIPVQISHYQDHELFFINRHGQKLNLPPHMLNYRGNIQAFASSNVHYILSVATVGSMKPTLKPGDMVIPHDILDTTRSRQQTFFDVKRVHVDMTEPFCSAVRDTLIQGCKKTKGVRVHTDGVCLVTEGPRLETAAEITFYSSVASIVNMTLSPEVVLAREKGICYGALCLVCNMATGLQHRLPAEEIAQVYKKTEPLIATVLQTVMESFDASTPCHCPVDLSKATL